MTLDFATQIAQAAFAEGRVRGVLNVSVAVVDVGGSLRPAMPADGHGIFDIDIARAKATTALGFNRSTLQRAQGPSGVTIGAAAVAGGAPEVDEAIIVAAIRAAGLTVPP